LFIRAAQEGRRDHVYQACMFDPLAGATLRTDQIVEMCDEMIAAYGDELPPLHAKTLVPTSGKSFPKVDSRVLRASWDKVQKDSEGEFVQDWHIIGTFPGKPQATTIDTAGPVDALAGSAIDVSKPVAGKSWKAVKALKRGHVNLTAELGPDDWCLAYGYTEVHSVHARDVVMGVGSDDGVRVWLNGQVVHSHETGRGYSPNADKVTVRLNAGVNRILVKISQHNGGYGFGMSVPPANF